MPPLAIGFDASSTLAPRTGVGRAALGIIRALRESATPEQARFHVLLNSLTRRMGPEHAPLRAAPNINLVRKRRPGGALVRAWARGAGPSVEDLLGPDVEVYHAPASYMPPARKARRMISVYDLAFLDDPPEQRDRLGGALFTETFPRLLPACDCVVTASEFTRGRILEEYKLPPERVITVPLSIDADFFHIESERFVEIARHDLGIPGDSYFLGVSDHTPRKRAGLMLDAYERLLALEPEAPPLVVLGWRGKPAAELRARPHLYRHVFVLPHVADRQLAGLYTGAVATLFASRHEGFGFPVLEAQACGSPIICARNSSLEEVGGEGACFVPEDTIEGWAETIRRVAFDQCEHDRWREAGLANITRFSWHDTAQRMLKIYSREVHG